MHLRASFRSLNFTNTTPCGWFSHTWKTMQLSLHYYSILLHERSHLRTYPWIYLFHILRMIICLNFLKDNSSLKLDRTILKLLFLIMSLSNTERHGKLILHTLTESRGPSLAHSSWTSCSSSDRRFSSACSHSNLFILAANLRPLSHHESRWYYN